MRKISARTLSGIASQSVINAAAFEIERGELQQVVAGMTGIGMRDQAKDRMVGDFFDGLSFDASGDGIGLKSRQRSSRKFWRREAGAGGDIEPWRKRCTDCGIDCRTGICGVAEFADQVGRSRFTATAVRVDGGAGGDARGGHRFGRHPGGDAVEGFGEVVTHGHRMTERALKVKSGMTNDQ